MGFQELYQSPGTQHHWAVESCWAPPPYNPAGKQHALQDGQCQSPCRHGLVPTRSQGKANGDSHRRGPGLAKGGGCAPHLGPVLSFCIAASHGLHEHALGSQRLSLRQSRARLGTVPALRPAKPAARRAAWAQEAAEKQTPKCGPLQSMWCPSDQETLVLHHAGDTLVSIVPKRAVTGLTSRCLPCMVFTKATRHVLISSFISAMSWWVETWSGL